MTYLVVCAAVLRTKGDELLHGSVWCVPSAGDTRVLGVGPSAGSTHRATQVHVHGRPHEGAQGSLNRLSDRDTKQLVCVRLCSEYHTSSKRSLIFRVHPVCVLSKFPKSLPGKSLIVRLNQMMLLPNHRIRKCDFIPHYLITFLYC